MAKAKIIDVGNGYALRFDQRAKGQETPYWVGTIFKSAGTNGVSWEQVGSFENGGTGGPTSVRSNGGDVNLSEVFSKIMKEGLLKGGAKAKKIEKAKYMEFDAMMVEYAHAIGYEKGWSTATFEDFCKAEVEAYRKYDML